MFSSDDRRKALDSVAPEFERFRPGYPAALFDTILAETKLPPDAQILEIGCGPGRAVLPFAERGYRIICLEPGPNLAAIAARNLKRFKNVRISVEKFEDWSAANSSLDLIIAAQSFHLVDESVRVSKAVRLLKPGGSLAIFGNEPRRGNSIADRLIHEAYAAHAPDAEQGWTPTPLPDSGAFETIIKRKFTWRTSYTADDYVGLMKTRTPIIRLSSESQRNSLLTAIHHAIEQQGSLEVTYFSRLCLATRAV